jgi:protein involved in polysaccharide export with SLBB domain
VNWLAFVQAVSVALLAGIATASLAQSIKLSPEQQAMLDQLPPAQRQQALDALEQLQQQQASKSDGLRADDDETMPIPGLEADPLAALEPEIEEPSAKAGSRLVVDFEPRFDLEARELRQLKEDPALNRIIGSQYFELDDRGVLAIPGLPEIPLRGLSEDAIEARLGAESALKPFEISAYLLDVDSAAAEALSPFGYDVFSSRSTGFRPVTSGPVPPDYVLGPGDSIRVQLFGNVNGIYEFEVSRDGVLNLPELGPITVAGLPFSEFRRDLNRRVEQMLIGTQVSVTMGQLRTIQVFVLGDASWPGSYVVSSLATISSALYSSGGISEIGSLRRIQLKRGGQVVTTLDLYDLLLRGDTSGDMRLQPGDVIFIPPVGKTVGVSGAVRRPAIYELRGETRASEIVALSGGLRPVAYPAAARIERIDKDNRRVVVSVDIESAEGARTPMSDGDTLYVPEVLPKLQDSVILSGHVQRPGAVQLKSAMRLADLIPSANYLLPGADTSYTWTRPG